MKTNRCVTQSCTVRPTERVETMMMTGVKSNICIGSFVTQIFLQFTLPHSLIQCWCLRLHSKKWANGNVWSVICCRQIGWQLEFERDSNDSSHFFSVSGRALTVSGHFTTKSSFDVLHFSLSLHGARTHRMLTPAQCRFMQLQIIIALQELAAN